MQRLLVANCAETGERLSAHLEGDLRGLRRRRVLNHLARCEHCRAVLGSVRRAIEAVRGLRVLDAPAGPGAEAVVERIRREASRR